MIFPKNHKLRKIFNRNTIKLSYSCMSNVKQKITAHNRKRTNAASTNNNLIKCNCRNKDACPTPGKCTTPSVIYQATVKTINNTRADETYIGLTENSFKTRYTNHKSSFNNQHKRHSTELSKYIWELKDKGISYSIAWKILTQARPYSTATGRCNLCLTEKYHIICKPNMASLNKRNELVSTCRHARKFLLGSAIT